MRSRLHCVLLAPLVLATCSAPAQMHKVAKPEQVVRAVGVYEYTGDLAKPAASRLIPVSLYIDGKFEDAGIYIARPVPFALLSGNVYELESAGTPKALLDLVYARHLQATEATGDLAYDDGWFGYGKVQPLAIPRRTSPLKASKTNPVLQSSVKDTASSVDPDRPVMIRRNGTNTSSASSSTPAANPPADNPDRPTMKRRDSSTNSSGASSAGTPPDDPDRPTMKRTSPATDPSGGTPSDAGNGGASTSGSGNPGSASAPAADAGHPARSQPGTASPDSSESGSTAPAPDPATDPDRPTLKRRTPEQARKARNANTGASATGYDSLNDDPSRPNLHHGKPTQALTETDLPKLTGLPQNLHQMVAVSDAVDRNTHSFTLAWEDAGQRAAILEKMQALARAQLAAYGKPAAGSPSAATTSAPRQSPKPSSSSHTRQPSHSAHKSAAQPLIQLEDEDLQAYLLSYGGDPTYIYSAHTAGAGAALRYVTIVAQSDTLGQFKPAIENVTDAARLDDKPRMRFIDAVDAEAGNRASLLFELRGQTARQFALYRVIAGHSDQIFLTGTTQ